MEDLWPSNFAVGHIETAPVVILREQGTLLGQKTNNIVEGEIVSHSDESLDPAEAIMSSVGRTQVEREVKAKEPVFYHSFYIKVPSLGNYRYRLFYVRHFILPYPATIYSNDGKKIECQNEHEFKEALRRIFFEEETQRIIATLLAQGTSPVGATS